MKPKDPIIFGKQKLVFNSAKNRYDNDNEINNLKGDINKTNNLFQNKSNYNSADSLNEYESNESAVSNTIISKEDNCNNSDNLNLNININKDNSFNLNKNEKVEGFLGENKAPDVTKIYKEEDSQDLLTLQIKKALKKMEQEYYYNYEFKKNKTVMLI